MKMHLVSYNTKSKSYRMWNPAEPTTNSAEVSFREKATRDPLPEPGRIMYQPGSEEDDKEKLKTKLTERSRHPKRRNHNCAGAADNPCRRTG